MSIYSWLFKKEIDKIEDSLKRTLGSDFYQALLHNVQNRPVYMEDNIEAYIKYGYQYNPTVFSIISFITQKASTIPWGVYEVKNEKALNLYKSASPNLSQFQKNIVKTKAMTAIEDHELNGLFMNPNVLQTWSEFIEQVIGFKLITGNGYIQCIGPTGGINAGTISEMWNLPSPAVTIVAGDRFAPVKMYQMLGHTDVNIPPEQMIHLKYWTPAYANGLFLYGMSPIQAARRVVTKSNASYDSMVASFQNMGAVGIISPKDSVEELTPEQQVAMEDLIERKTGPNRRGKPLVSGTPLQWQQIGMSPADLAIIESDKMDLRTLCSVYHVSSELFNDSANKTHANMKEAGSSAYTNAVIPALNQLKEAINQKIHRSPQYKNIYVDYDTSMISELQEDLQAMTTSLTGAWWITPNERRDIMNFGADDKNPLMDDYWVSPGLMPMNGSMIDDAAIEAAAKMLDIK